VEPVPLEYRIRKGVVAVMVTLSVALTVSVLFPSISARQIVTIVAACTSACVVASALSGGAGPRRLP